MTSHESTVFAAAGPPPVSNTLWRRCVKRSADVALASLLLVLLAPLLVVIAALVKLTSRGPVLFVQQRGGWHGRRFFIRKFRTMRGDRTPDPKELVPLTHADITAVGRLLRRFKLDELPQLLSVLTGEMSLIGPRPTLPDQVEAYDAFRRQRLLVRPGITGLAQVYGNASVPWDERILYDIAYVRRCSFRLDCHILLRTAWVLIVGERRTTRSFVKTKFSSDVKPPSDYGQTMSPPTG